MEGKGDFNSGFFQGFFRSIGFMLLCMIWIVSSGIGFLVGVICRGITDFPLWPILIVGAILMIKNRKMGFVVLAFLIGVLRMSYFLDSAPTFWPTDSGLIEGKVVSEVDRREDSQKIVLDTDYGRVLVTISLYKEVNFGDKVRVFGALEKPSDDIDGFNYENYLAGQGIWLTMQARSFEVLSPAGFSLRGSLFAFKKLVEERLNYLYFEPEASFSAGLLIGSRRGMPEKLSDAFRKVGLMHIVAISGSNISLVIYMISFLLVFLPFKRRMIVASAAVGIFVCLVGASAAVVRAGFMGILGLFGLYMGKKSQAIFALLWSAIFMVVLNPLVILYDSGFQLSFSATLGLLCFVPMLDKALGKFGAGSARGGDGNESKISFVREALLMTVAAQIATFPVTTFSFGTFSLIAPLANVLAAPLIPFAMLFSGLSVIFGKPLAIVATFYLQLIEWIAILFAKIPYVSLPVSVGPIGFVLLEIALISFLLGFYKSKLARAFLRVNAAETSKALSPQFEKRETQ